MRHLSLFFFISLSSCQINRQADTVIQTSDSLAESIVTDSVERIQNSDSPNGKTEGQEDTSLKEYSIMYADSVKLASNKFNRISFETEVEEFLKKMGQPDSTVDPKYDCGYFATEQVPVELYYYQGSSFNAYHGKAEIKTLDFTKTDLTIEYPHLILNKHTTLEEIKRHFPASYRNAYVLEQDGNDYTYLRFWAGEKIDDQIVLKFFRGKLVEFDLWMPC
jgi:hypothetical protein